MPRGFRLYGSAIVLLAILLLACPALAQFGEAVGSLYGKVVDDDGAALPNVAITLMGVGAPQSQVTNAKGAYRFLNLSPGRYTVTLALPGFTTLNHENAVVDLGRNTEITDTLRLSPVAAAVTVTGAAPLLDTRNVELGAQITPEEMKSIPTARDPWVILQSVPGIQIDRVNVGGSESGGQSGFVSKGSSGSGFAVDGINFTDMGGPGGSASYYDFDSFQEIQVITGGGDPSIQGDGAHINMLTKRGTNEVHGSARVNVVSDHFEWTNLSEEAKTQSVDLADGNRITSIQEYGAEAGGPVIKDHLWLWGSYGRNQIGLLRAGGGPDDTTLENFNGKLDAQPLASNSMDVYYQRSDKLKFGRGAGTTRSQEATTNQTTPANWWKLQDSQVFTSNLFASAQYNGTDGRFTLTPQGGLAPQIYVDPNGTVHNSFYFLDARRPQRQVKGDLSFFFNTGSLGHELKAGFGYLTTQSDSIFGWGGDGSPIGDSGPLAAKTIGHDDGFCYIPCAGITRDGGFRVEAKYWNFWIGDTMTLDRLTVNAGIRWDKQYGDNIHRFIPGNPTFPQVLPDLNYPGTGREFTWEDWQPRVGATYALGSSRNTLVKANYARYAATLGQVTVGLTNPLGYTSYIYYAWNDANGDHHIQPGEVDLSSVIYAYYVNPANPADTSSPNRIDPKLSAPHTDELIVGVDHELLPNLAVGVAYTHRKFKDFVWGAPYYKDTNTILTRADYELAGILANTDPLRSGQTPDPIAYSEPYYRISQSVLDAHNGDPPRGFFYTNRPDYDQTFDGVDFTITKRLSNRWMLRGWFSYNDHKQQVGPNGCVDPTNVQSFTYGQLCRTDNLVAPGGRGTVFLNSKWQFNVNGMYQLPWNFNFALNFLGRQGYPLNYFRRVNNAGDGIGRNVEVLPTNAVRYDNVYELDIRIEKVIPIFNTGSLAIAADIFNVANSATVLQRYNRLRRPETNQIRETQSPRVVRFGARVSF
jgi:hypothetical protein